MKVKLNITKQHISKGVKFSSTECVVSVCMKDMGYKDTYTSYGFVTSIKDGKKYIADLSIPQINWLIEFDYRTVKPVTLVLKFNEIK